MANVVGIAAEQLQQIVLRIERLEEEKKGIADDIKDVYAEAKSNGFDVKILRECIKLRKMDRAALQERDALLELYRDGLDMPPDSSVSPADDALDAQTEEVSDEPVRAAPAAARSTIGASIGGADLLAEATLFVRTLPRVSVNDVQRHFRMSYVRAHALMERLHTAGVVGPAKGNRRKVLPYEGDAATGTDPRLRKALKKMVDKVGAVEITTGRGSVLLSNDLLGDLHGRTVRKTAAA